MISVPHTVENDWWLMMTNNYCKLLELFSALLRVLKTGLNMRSILQINRLHLQRKIVWSFSAFPSTHIGRKQIILSRNARVDPVFLQKHFLCMDFLA